MVYTTPAEVYRATGLNSSVISEPDVTNHIAEAQKEVDYLLGTTFEPKTVSELYDGTGQTFLFLKKYPVLRVKSLIIDETTITLTYVYVYTNSGKLILKRGGEKSIFKTTDPQEVAITYDYADLVETKQTTSTADVEAGNSKTLTVADGSIFKEKDYIKISGSYHLEIAKITAIDTNNLTIDTLINAYSSGAIITLLETPTKIKRLCACIAGIRTLVQQIGGTYDDITSYGLGDLSVSKGEPYMNIKATVEYLQKEINNLLKYIKKKPVVM